MSFRLLSFKTNVTDAPIAGLLLNGKVIPVVDVISTDEFDASSVLSIIKNWEFALPLLTAADTNSSDGKDLNDLTLTAPILYPSNIFCAAANYQDHFREMSGDDVDKSKINPYFFKI